MAEIKSTREKVLERLAAMDAAAGPVDLDREEKIKDGMRLAAAALRGEETELPKKLAAFPGPEQPLILQGIVRTLLRNIVLPRDSLQREDSEKALQALSAVSGSDLKSTLKEMKTVVGQYLEHREQLKDQLKAAFAQQMGQVDPALGSGTRMKVDPSQHPKFAEEWLRVQDELNSQYGRALEQYKAMIEQRLATV